jgi:hypothetical protein
MAAKESKMGAEDCDEQNKGDTTSLAENDRCFTMQD